MAGNIYNMSDMTYPEFNALDRDRTLILQGVSPVEVHGTHMPLKTDYFTVESLLKRAAKSIRTRLPGWDAVISPTLPVGSDTLPLPGSIEIRPRILKGLMTDYGCSLARHGFRHIALLSAHGGPRHDAALELACRAVMRRHRDVQMFTPTGDVILYVMLGDITEDLKERLRGIVAPEIIDTLLPSDVHAGALETSLGLLFMPELIKKDYGKLPDNTFGTSNRLVNRAVRSFFNQLARLVLVFPSYRKDPEKTRLFYYFMGEMINMFVLPDGPVPVHAGFPRKSSKVLGRAYADLIVERAVDMIHDVITGKRDIESTFTLFSRSALIRAGVRL